MPGTPTPNYGLYIGTVGGDTGVWGADVNTNLTAFLDGFLGNTLGKAITVSDVTLTLSEWQNNGIFKLTGVLTGNRNFILPFNGATGAGAAVGGKFIVDNECIGNFTVTVKTIAAGSTGVIAPQGARTSLYSDQTNVLYADDSRTAKVQPNAGNPNGSLTGNAGNPATGQGTDLAYDTTNQQLYASLGGTSWGAVGLGLSAPQGYLTPVTGTPVIVADATAVTTIFYTPYKGNLVPLSSNGGVSFSAFPFSELSIGLSGVSAGDIRDVFVFLNSGVVAVGWGPAWSIGAGAMTAGACARGTGAGSTALSRTAGYLTNSVAMILNNPASFGTSGSIPAGQALYVGSIICSTAGQVNLHRSYGQSRKWEIWNAFNRVPIILQGGDNTATWTYAGSGVWRQSNAAAGNQLSILCGLAEEEVEIAFDQMVKNSANGLSQIGIGMNSTTSPSGFSTVYTISAGGQNGQLASTVLAYRAKFIQGPQLSSVAGYAGLTNSNMIELGGSTTATATFNGTSALMVMTARYQG